MSRRLAGLLLVALLALAGVRPLSAAEPAAAEAAARSQALLQQIDLQALPPAEREVLLLGVADQLQAAGQPAAALDCLVRALDGSASPPSDTLLQKVDLLLRQLDRATLEKTVFLYPGTAVAVRAQHLLGAGGLPEAVLPEMPSPAVGVLLPLSGRYAPYGEMVRRGMELARAGVGARVRFLYRDSAGDGPTAIARMEELARDPQVLAVLGPLTSAAAAPAAEVANRSGLPLLALSQREGVAAAGPYLFRSALTPSAQVSVLADHALRTEGLRRFAVLHPATRQGELFAGLFRAAIEKSGGSLVASQDYPAGALDLRQQLELLAAAARAGGGAEALFLPDAAPQVAQIIPQLGFSRLDGLQLLGIAAWNDPELVRLAGPQIEGAIFVDGFFADSPRPDVRDFVAGFQSAHGMPPGILAAQGHDAARIVLTLLARPEVRDRETLRQALSTLHDFPGVTGRTTFGPQGDAEKILFLLQVQDGTVVQIN